MNSTPFSRLALAALFGGAVGIAFAPIFVRWSEVGPSATAFYRVFLALPLLALWMAREELHPPFRKPASADFRLLALAGFFFAGDLALWHWSIKLTSVANATLLANFAPIFVTLGARILFGERITPLFVSGMLVAFVGAAMLLRASFTFDPKHLLGDIVGLSTAVFYGSYMLTVKRLRQTFTSATIMTWSGVSTCICLIPVAMLSSEQLVPLSATGWLVLAGLALFSHVGGQGMIAYAFGHLPASFSSVALLLQPAVATLLAWVLLKEKLTPLQLLGGIIVLGGIVIAAQATRESQRRDTESALTQDSG